MTNVTPTAPNPVTDKQMAAALALADILDHGLPLVHWIISDTTTGLEGMVFRTVGTQAERDAQEREGVRAYAEFLGAGYRENRGESSWTLVETIGAYEGVRVRVWANVDDDNKLAEEAAALAATEAKPVSA